MEKLYVHFNTLAAGSLDLIHSCISPKNLTLGSLTAKEDMTYDSFLCVRVSVLSVRPKYFLNVPRRGKRYELVLE